MPLETSGKRQGHRSWLSSLNQLFFKKRKKPSPSNEEIVDRLKNLGSDEIISILSDIDDATKRNLIFRLKRLVNPLPVSIGQVVKFNFDKDERYGCVIGGGQNLKICFIDSDSEKYAYINRYDILETTEDRLHVKKDGSYKWPVKKIYNEKYFEDNQKIINKYANKKEQIEDKLTIAST